MYPTRYVNFWPGTGEYIICVQETQVIINAKEPTWEVLVYKS